jgi:diguanylate cyclase (GGDEF)-like protein
MIINSGTLNYILEEVVMVFNERYHVLVVDSQNESLERIIAGFEDEGYEVSIASTFDQLVYELEEDDANLLVLNFKSDIQLQMDIYRKFRQDERYLAIPVLGLFSSLTVEEKDHYIDLGIDSVCVEPFSAKELIIRAEHLIELNQYRVNAEQKELAFKAMYLEVNNLKSELKAKHEDINQLRDSLSRMAVLDTLTGLFNRTYVLEQLEMAISRFNRKQIESSIILCDIDNIVAINSQFGHNIGDKMIREIGIELTKKKRNQDIIARYSGDSYLILLPDTELEGAKFFAERARKTIEQKMFGEKEDIQLTMTFGVAIYNQTMPFDMLMRLAEDALAYGKETGKNKVVVANELIKLN